MSKEIVQGSTGDITIRLTDNRNDGDPLDLTDATEISSCFKNADGSLLLRTETGSTITILSAVLGKLKILLTPAETLLLKTVDEATLELKIVFPTETIIKLKKRAYSVIEKIC